MQGHELYEGILGLKKPWFVSEVKVDIKGNRVDVWLDHASEVKWACPECGKRFPLHDHQAERTWRHLDTCQLQTLVHTRPPRVSCKEHGVLVAKLPWAEPHSRFTAMFEALMIDLLKEASITGVTRIARVSWAKVDGIMQRAVKRGMARRELVLPSRIGVDETSFQKRHEYVTVVSDPAGTVLYVADDRGTGALDGFYKQFDRSDLEGLEAVSMDMWDPYIRSTREHVPDAKQKICFDKFHVAKHLGEAVDKTRRHEHRNLMRDGDETLKGTKYAWLRNPDNMDWKQWNRFEPLRNCALKTSRAWAIKEHAMVLWGYVTRGWAKKAWKRWLAWAVRSRLPHVKKVAKTIKRHLYGILNAIVLRATNARSESINAKIQRIKRMACGFRSRQRMRNAILFHAGKLDLYPSPGGIH